MHHKTLVHSFLSAYSMLIDEQRKIFKPITRYWINTSNKKYYQGSITYDLFDLILLKVWGRQGESLGRIQSIPINSIDHGLQLIEQIAKRREKRGYIESATNM